MKRENNTMIKRGIERSRKGERERGIERDR